MKMLDSWLKFHSNLFPWVQFNVTEFSIGSDNGLAPNIIWTNDGLVVDAYMRHPASTG